MLFIAITHDHEQWSWVFLYIYIYIYIYMVSHMVGVWWQQGFAGAIIRCL